MDPGADGADGDVQGTGDLAVVELPPCEQNQRLPIERRQPLERLGQPRAERLGLQLLKRLLDGVQLRKRDGSSIGPLASLRRAEVMAQKVGGDPVEPRPRIVETAVVASTMVEGQPEGLSGDVLATRASAARAVGVESGPVTIEDPGELLGLLQRTRYEGRVGRRRGRSSRRGKFAF